MLLAANRSAVFLRVEFMNMAHRRAIGRAILVRVENVGTNHKKYQGIRKGGDKLHTNTGVSTPAVVLKQDNAECSERRFD